MSDDSLMALDLTLGKLRKLTIRTSYRKGLVVDAFTYLVIESSPMTARKNKSDRKRNRKQRWC